MKRISTLKPTRHPLKGHRTPHIGGRSVLTLVFAAAILASGGATAAGASKSLSLRPLLLNVEQMPTGWTVDHSALASGCDQPKGVRVTQSVTASYGDGANGQVVEQLKTYSVAVETAYKKVLASFNSCKHERVGGPTGKSLTATFGQMSLPQYGNQSEAFDAQVSHKGQITNVYEVVIRSGNIIATVSERGAGPGSIPQFQTTTSEALLKLPFGGTAPTAPPHAVPTTATTAPPKKPSTPKKATAPTKPAKLVPGIGSTLTVLNEDKQTEAVKLVAVIDPAQPADEFNTPDAGTRLVAVEVQITNESAGTDSNDAYDNLAVVGTNNQVYSPALNTVSECTDFDDGQYRISQGASEVGCVACQVPTAVPIAKVQYNPDAGFSTNEAQWTLSPPG